MKKIRVYVHSYILLLCLTLQVHGQQVQPIINASLYGKVIDSSTKNPVEGATVQLKAVTHAVTKDRRGSFEFVTGQKLPLSVTVSYVGYQTKEFLVNSSPAIIELAPSADFLEEVVVVGYGKQKRTNLTGAVASLDGKTLSNRPITSSSQALQNLPGVYTNQTKGRPGADGAQIRVRGVGTLNNNNPLVLVDGVEYDLDKINPNDIASISVLKDAASAAIYGNRAANGVILVTTKQGNKGSSAVDYSAYFGAQRAMQFPQVVTNTATYMVGRNRALANEGKPPEYTDELIEEFRNNNDGYIYANTDWMDVMFRDAPIQEHNLRISGGNEKTTHSVSMGYLDQKGILIETSGKRYSLNTNIQSQVGSFLKVGASLMGTYGFNQESAYTADEGNGEGGILGLTYRALPFQVAYDQQGNYADQWIRVPGHNFYRNTVALSKEGYRRNNDFNPLANVFLEFKIPFDIQYKVTAAANLVYGLEKYNYPSIDLTNPKTGQVTPIGNTPIRGIRQISDTKLNLTNFHTLNWTGNFNDHGFNVLAGFSWERFDDGNFSAYNQGYLSNALTELNVGSTSAQVTGTSTETKLLSYFGRLNYNYKDRYLLEGNFRYDGSSRFAEGNRWGFFPSISGGWRISEEEFFKPLTIISNLKLRASYGKLGNQSIPNFSYVNSFGLGENYTFGGNLVPGAAVRQIADPAITWETTTITDIGLEAGFFQNRLSLEIDWFDKTTSNILRQITIPGQIGNLNGPFQNIGIVNNNGVELILGYQSPPNDFQYHIQATGTWVKNEVVDLKDQVYYDGNTIIQQGQSINAFYGLQAEGLFQNQQQVEDHAFQSSGTSPGDIRYADLGGNGIIDNNDRTVIGNSIPKLTYGFNLGLAYKGFDLSMIFQGVGKVDTYLTGNLAFPYKNGAGVTQEWLTDSWTPENTNASLPRLTTSNGYPQNFQTSSFWVRNAAYLRLKNVQLSYGFSPAVLSSLRLKGLKVFVNAQNLLTFTDFKFSDPERNLTRANLIEYPNTKSITAGINLSL